MTESVQHQDAPRPCGCLHCSEYQKRYAPPNRARLVIAKTSPFELRSAATGRVVDKQQPFGRPQRRCHDAKRNEYDERARRAAAEVLSARGSGRKLEPIGSMGHV